MSIMRRRLSRSREGSSLGSITWAAETPRKAWIRAQPRSAETKEGLEAATWEGPDGTETWDEKGQRALEGRHRRWVQYKLALGSKNSLSAPRLTRVDVHYRTGE